MNKKCPNCGFINFVSAEACRKCETILPETINQSFYDDGPAYRGGVNAYHQPYPTKRKFSLVKALVFVLVGLVVMATVSGWVLLTLSRKANKIKWVEYHPDGLNFTVMMPNKPTRLEPVLTALPTGSMSNHRYISGVSGQGTAMFCFVDFTGTMFESSEAEEALDAELTDFLNRTNSTLVAKRSISYQGMPGLEFEVSPPAGVTPRVIRGYGKMFLTPTRLYFLSITAAEGTDLHAGKDKFLNPRLPADPFRGTV